jgi:ubiquinone/menaquinone biosynthesis C-methylase UbiE
MNCAAPNWDALADYWHYFEAAGLNKPVLSMLMVSLVPPVLYVGGGRGTLPAHLRQYYGPDQITVIDLSLAMARRAKKDFELDYILNDVRHLAFPDQIFSSVVCTTGVLEYVDAADQAVSLVEMARVCRSGGPIMVTAGATSDPIGASQGAARNYFLLEMWFRHYESLSLIERQAVLAYNGVARAMGDREAAYRLLKDSLSPYDPRILMDEFAATIATAGLFIQSVQYLHDRGIAIWKLSTLPFRSIS